MDDRKETIAYVNHILGCWLKHSEGDDLFHMRGLDPLHEFRCYALLAVSELNRIGNLIKFLAAKEGWKGEDND